MTFKQFYLICLLGITLCGGIYLALVWFSNYKKSKENSFIKEINQGLFFIILAIFSWTIVVINKFFDVKDFSLAYIINDRILSSLNNLFLMSSLVFFPLKKDFFLTRFFKKKEQWVINVFIVFVLIIAFFSITDKISNDIGPISRLIIVGLDSIVSISSIIIFGYVLYHSFLDVFKNEPLLNFIKTIVVLFAITQIILPLTKLIPDYLSEFYPYFLALFLVFISIFIFIIAIYYTLISYTYSYKFIKLEDDFDTKPTVATDIVIIQMIQIGYEKESKRFYIKLNFITKEGKEDQETNYNSKLLQPYLYWVLFTVAKKNNALIFNQDIAVAKFRMVEYWNKESNFKLSQDVLFYNESGNFEFRIEKNAIELNEHEFFKSKISVKEILRKHLLCFIDSETLKTEQLNNRKNAEKYITENFSRILETLL